MHVIKHPDHETLSHDNFRASVRRKKELKEKKEGARTRRELIKEKT